MHAANYCTALFQLYHHTVVVHSNALTFQCSGCTELDCRGGMNKAEDLKIGFKLKLFSFFPLPRILKLGCSNCFPSFHCQGFKNWVAQIVFLLSIAKDFEIGLLK